MSILVSFSIFPTDTQESKSVYVSKVIERIRESGLPYKLTPMSTIVETESLEEALAVLAQSYEVLEPFSNRVYLNATFDIRKNKSGRLAGKIQSVENKIGKVNT
ncbi:MAG: hypothetical protein BWY70_00039 [Bacteroidetes bacterium ADurb.Bin408]|nr:MAG: hypothetical protein BWY70_00039 [Bacteroidetes bacterium ADurb.Bin408]